jgi:hypothetical protein
MPAETDWTPEQGDDVWVPEDGKTYTDAEIRFGPLYREVKAIYSEYPEQLQPSESELLAECRSIIQRTQQD